MKIYLVRHGSTVYTQENRLQGCLDIPLSQKGEEEASLLAGRLKHDKIDSIVCSNLKRAKTTASIISKPHNITPTFLTYIREYSWGPVEGLTIKELEEKYPALLKRAKGLPLSVPGGETDRRLKSRARMLKRFLHAKYEENSCNNIIIVTHGRFLQFFLLYALQLPLSGQRPFVINPASLTILEVNEVKRFRLLLLNDTCHLK